ncbi:MAG: DUF6069 family protein [Flavobacteriales bacterium]
MTPRTRQTLNATLVAASLSSAINVLLFSFFTHKSWLNPMLKTGENESVQELTAMGILIASTLPIVVGSLIYLLLVKYTNNPKWIYWTMALLMMFLSFINPFMIPGVEISTAISLNIMHIVCAVGSAFFLTRWVD